MLKWLYSNNFCSKLLPVGAGQKSFWGQREARGSIGVATCRRRSVALLGRGEARPRTLEDAGAPGEVDDFRDVAEAKAGDGVGAAVIDGDAAGGAVVQGRAGEVMLTSL